MINLGLSAFLKNRLLKDKKKVVLKIPSEISQVRKVSSKVEKAIALIGTDEPKLFDIRLCLEEAVRNAIVHGNKCNKKLKVMVSYSLDGDKFIMEVADEGAGFDYNKVPDPTSGENLTKNSGRGVYLIKKLMDEVSFSGHGNTIRMVKRLK